MSQLRHIAVLVVLLTSAIGSAEPAVHTSPAFPARIQAIQATETGAYVLDGSRQIWFVEPTGAARIVPIPLDGRIETIAYEPSGGLLWGCTREAVFATNAAGAWQSWGLGDATTRQNCFVAPSPGGTTWVVANSANADGFFVEYGAVGNGELTSTFQRLDGLGFALVGTDEAGGLWALAQYPVSGLVHFDGASWRAWSAQRLQWVGTGVLDVFPLGGGLWPELLASDGTGGLVAPSSTELFFMRSTAPYPAVDRVGTVCPDCGLSDGTLAVGDQRVWGVGRAKNDLVLTSWDFTGIVASAESIEVPRWLDPDELYRGTHVAADAHAVWVAIDGAILRRGSDGWAMLTSRAAIEERRRDRNRETDGALAIVGLGAGGALFSIAAPGMWAPKVGVSYPRAGGETLAAWGLGIVGHWAIVTNDPWQGGFRGVFDLAFGLVLNTGIATVATVTPETFFDKQGEPFPVYGAVIGAAAGYATGALLDLVLHAAGVESAVGRGMLWSGFTGVGGPLGFHLARKARGGQ